MKFNALTPKSVLYFLCCFLTFYSCSKDSDLFTDYISEDSNLVIENLIRNDAYQVAIVNNSEEEITEIIVSDENSGSNEIIGSNDNDGTIVNDNFELIGEVSIVLDVLANDTFVNKETATIIETTQPTNGEVIINSDNTLTFIPTVTGNNVNNFSYTTEFIKSNGSVGKETGSVSVAITENPNKISEELGELKAFPGAEGFGKNATGGRGGIIVEVTNLNDSGPGSLREALTMTMTRTIVFKVGGTIECDSYLSIPSNSGNLTIAGQTAPGTGITIKGAELRISASNVIVRYLKIRPGNISNNEATDGLRIVAFNGSQVKDIIVDHCSIAWASDENLNIGGVGSNSSVRNITIQNSIIAENIATGYGLLIWQNAKNISIYRNLLAHNSTRNIRSSTCTSDFEMVNNILYGFRTATVPTYENAFDIVGNVYKSNPNTPVSDKTVKLEASVNNCPDGKASLTKAYISDNLFDGGNITIESQLNSYLVNNKIFNSGIQALNADEVENSLLNNVGASILRDDIDKRIVNDVKNLSGTLKSSTAAAGGYDYTEITNSYQDTDKDGIDDSWEQSNDLNPNDTDDGSLDINGDGFTNLEEFLHYLTIN
ncbi:Ig-like domain-containing protein [Eudoraea chungangensis]|uniref:Ig-like domain-containing protein n=1 Tax=Eudoraea chungangensis TaxID=1481905 RepID=UPI0023EC0AB6|nr:Ig-like domain-containing protein [Eudoraea chungangensis]